MPAGHGRPVEPAVPLDAARVVVAGLGVSGRAVVAALAGRVRELVTVDARADDADVRGAAAEDRAGLDDLVAGADLVVASPGWAPSTPLLAAATAAGVPVWSEVELAWRLRVDRRGPDGAARGPAPWLAVTGTNGKTTTVEMLASILAAAGLRTAAVGNVGTPLLTAAVDPDLDVLAVELSSFQLHFTHTMSVEAGAVLNVAPDHLDWHGSLEAYAADKGRIYARAQVACVYTVADPRTEDLVREADVVEGARAVGVTLGTPGPGQLGLVEDVLVDRAFHAPADAADRRTYAAELGTLADLAHLAPAATGDGPAVPPPHVVSDALAAAALARAHGVPAAAVRDGLRSFRPGAHRIERVRVLGGVAYVDDSKATNPHAAAASLATYEPGTVVWVAGGLAKGARLDDLVERRADRLRAAVVIGVDPAPWTEALARHAPEIPVVRVDPGDTGSVMRRAVAAARDLARPGDTVLLAPAGASMDQFRSYAERGAAFAAAVQELDE
ncbi:UDP-N-acetylmuramoyl-L-alanine--D-glutamate ligase [Isoptericola variabilis]|uniref:UDP-N-acetylmuramoylalanine--D-glutamate ligase n=1 Tax=Isoptericola variabilis (strain 225) TaxID=743718 RepID=F6FSJ0_ISOV2|nr:UDP-N-acetylmuramoyl-L-alanine--D-glutamate ligase [Isoptericola variabilis]AEG44057.1 UDP-N-acetylmuramoylalanine--D-glutamate ligase [Isoptericola variabilis 225]TWH31755.1 UDP-N-acetylmuramoylalanine--D-glutamate ligase [Isoptericola variabilis J7]